MDHPHPSPSNPWVIVGAFMSTASGLVAWLSALPPAFYVSLGGIAGSIIVPLAKVHIDADRARLRAELEVIRADRDSSRRAESDLRTLLLAMSAPVPEAPAHAPQDPLSPGGPADGRGPEALRAPGIATDG